MTYLVSIEGYKAMHYLFMGYADKIIICLIFSFGVERCTTADSIVLPPPALPLAACNDHCLVVELPGHLGIKVSLGFPRVPERVVWAFGCQGSSRLLQPV